MNKTETKFEGTYNVAVIGEGTAGLGGRVANLFRWLYRWRRS